MKVEGKAAIVTGGGTGVGRATGLALAGLGCSVLVNYSRSVREAEETAGRIEALGVKSLPYKADVSDDAACRAMVEAAVKTFGRLDVLVNSAGTTRFISFQELDQVQAEDWARIMAVNVQGAFQCARAAKAPMEAAGAGAVVNVASTAGINAVGSSIPYCASKAALINLILSLARAMAPAVRVNAVAPGFITGRWLQGGLGAAYEIARQRVADSSLLKRVSDPEDIAEAIVSLITGSDLVTGQVIICDGGVHVGR